jgi:hypothetical protein
MSIYLLLGNIAFCIWVIFFNGAEKIEGTFAGHFEFGLAGEKASQMRFCAWLFLVASAIFVVYLLFSG